MFRNFLSLISGYITSAVVLSDPLLYLGTTQFGRRKLNDFRAVAMRDYLENRVKQELYIYINPPPRAAFDGDSGYSSACARAEKRARPG